MKYLLLASLLTACNWGLVDIEEKERICYDRKFVVKKDTSYIDSIPFKCGTTKVTTPFDSYLEPIF